MYLLPLRIYRKSKNCDTVIKTVVESCVLVEIIFGFYTFIFLIQILLSKCMRTWILPSSDCISVGRLQTNIDHATN